MFTRILDLTIVLLLGVMVLLPRPSVQARPAAEIDPETRVRIAALQAELLADPGAPDPSLALADDFMAAKRPEWAVAILGPALERSPLDHRLHHRKALALADHFLAGPAYSESERALELCRGGSSVPCGAATLSRLELLTSTLDRVKDIDMRQNPSAAKLNIIRGLLPTYLPPEKAKGAAKAPAKPANAAPVPPK